MMQDTGYRAGSIGGQATNAYTDKVQPAQPTRFSGCAGDLEAKVAAVNGLAERFQRVADRLGGSVPSEAEKAGIRGNGSCIAVQIEQSLEDFGGVLRKLDATAQRLEQL